MKKIILLLVSCIVFMLTSCDVENQDDLNNQEVNNKKASFKIIEINYGKNNIPNFNILKEELNVQAEEQISKGTLIWKVYNDVEIEAIEELVLLQEGVIAVKVKTITRNEVNSREGGENSEEEKEDGLGNEEDNNDVGKEEDTKGDGTTDSDEE